MAAGSLAAYGVDGVLKLAPSLVERERKMPESPSHTPLPLSSATCASQTSLATPHVTSGAPRVEVPDGVMPDRDDHVPPPVVRQATVVGPPPPTCVAATTCVAAAPGSAAACGDSRMELLTLASTASSSSTAALAACSSRVAAAAGDASTAASMRMAGRISFKSACPGTGNGAYAPQS